MIDMSKRYTTRDNRPVRILCTDRKDARHPICGLITDHDGREIMASWSSDGRYFLGVDEHVNDLVDANLADALDVLTLLTRLSYDQATDEELQDLIRLAQEVANVAHAELFRREETR